MFEQLGVLLHHFGLLAPFVLFEFEVATQLLIHGGFLQGFHQGTVVVGIVKIFVNLNFLFVWLTFAEYGQETVEVRLDVPVGQGASRDVGTEALLCPKTVVHADGNADVVERLLALYLRAAYHLCEVGSQFRVDHA